MFAADAEKDLEACKPAIEAATKAVNSIDNGMI